MRASGVAPHPAHTPRFPATNARASTQTDSRPRRGTTTPVGCATAELMSTGTHEEVVGKVQSSIRATARMTNVSKPTILKLLAQFGHVCADYHSTFVRDLRSKRIECDEIWRSLREGEEPGRTSGVRSVTACGFGRPWTPSGRCLRIGRGLRDAHKGLW
jgi:hypothetical protein